MSEVATFADEWNEMVRQLRVRHLVDRGKGCCWPMWPHGARPNFHFCGAPKVGPLSSYCITHVKAATAIEARQGGDAQRLHAKHESAVPEGQSHIELALKGAPPAHVGHYDDLPNLALVVADSQGPVTASASLGGGSQGLASESASVRQSAVNEFAAGANK